jgi:hypothetical protein
MASPQQVSIITSFGFDKAYVESLPHNHATLLIKQLFRISDEYYDGKLNTLSTDVKEVVRLHNSEKAASLVGDLSRAAR